MSMDTGDISHTLTTLFFELVNGAARDGAFVLNSGDAGLLRSLDKLSAREASRSVDGGATIAAHAQHLRFGLSLMNRWAAEGGDPFSNAKWDEAWKISGVNDDEWVTIREGLVDETQRWLGALGSRRQVNELELNGMVGSIAHLAYHFGAIRQIAASARGPREGSFQK
jgi:hypothetical protein